MRFAASLWSRPLSDQRFQKPVDTIQTLSFNLKLTPSQEKSRAQVPLPYAHEGQISLVCNYRCKCRIILQVNLYLQCPLREEQFYMNQTRLMTLTMTIPTKISISSQGSNYCVLQLKLRLCKSVLRRLITRDLLCFLSSIQLSAFHNPR